MDCCVESSLHGTQRIPLSPISVARAPSNVLMFLVFFDMKHAKRLISGIETCKR